MFYDPVFLKQAKVYIVTFTIAYVLTSLLTPLIADKSFGDLAGQFNKGLSRAAASVK